jgi:hypothetical protein
LREDRNLWHFSLRNILKLPHTSSLLGPNFIFLGRAIAQVVKHRLPTAAAQVRSQARSRGFMVDIVAFGQVSSEYFGFLCQFSLHKLLHIHESSHHRRCIVSLLTAWLNNRLKKESRTQPDLKHNISFIGVRDQVSHSYGKTVMTFINMSHVRLHDMVHRHRDYFNML